MEFRDYFRIRNYGLVEFIMVMYPILKQYSAPIFSVGDWFLYFAGFYCFFKYITRFSFVPLIVLCVYVIIHEIIVAAAIGGAPSYMINGTIDKILPLFLVMSIVPNVKYEKVRNCFYFVGGICLIGMLVHVVQIFVFGSSVSPFTIPFLNMGAMENADYVSAFRYRPVSFFAEPAAYAIFMLFPLAFCLMENNIKYALVISVFTLLSTSTNGYFQTGSLWTIYLIFNNGIKFRSRFLIAAIIAVAVICISGSELFSTGVSKIQNTNFDDDVRVTAGFYAYMNLPFVEKIIGVFAANPFDYFSANMDLIRNVNIEMSDKSLYLPMIWFYGVKYGIIGIIMVFVCMFKGWRYKELRPLVIACTMSFFTQSTTLMMPIFVILLVMNTRQIQLASPNPNNK